MNCTSCGSVLDSSARFCVACGAVVGSPVVSSGAAAAATAPAMAPAQTTKPCPYCGEQILQAAIKCRFCNSALTGPVAAGSPNISVQGPTMAAGQPSIVIQNVQSGPAHQQMPVYREIKSPGVALLLSVIFPGGGQFYNGHAGKGILVLLTFWMIIPYFWSLFDAYSSAQRINRVGF